MKFRILPVLPLLLMTVPAHAYDTCLAAYQQALEGCAGIRYRCAAAREGYRACRKTGDARRLLELGGGSENIVDLRGVTPEETEKQYQLLMDELPGETYLAVSQGNAQTKVVTELKSFAGISCTRITLRGPHVPSFQRRAHELNYCSYSPIRLDCRALFHSLNGVAWTQASFDPNRQVHRKTLGDLEVVRTSATEGTAVGIAGEEIYSCGMFGRFSSVQRFVRNPLFVSNRSQLKPMPGEARSGGSPISTAASTQSISR